VKNRALPGIVKKTPKEFDQDFVRKLIMSMLRMTKEDLNLTVNNPDASCLELAVGAMIVSSIKDSNLSKFDFLLNRSIGREQENIAIALPPSVQYITEINADGNLIQTVLNDDNVIDIKQEKNDETI